MTQRSIQTDRRPRADAARNRERLIESAKVVFSSGGSEASLEAVARHAGVGIGTLYRHFPTRETLFEAVYRHEVGQLAAYAKQLSSEPDPLAALRLWLRANVELVATKKGMLAALALAIDGSSELYAFSAENLTKAIQLLLDRAIESDVVRKDITAEDILRALIGMCYANDRPGWQDGVLRMVDVLVDGLKTA